MSSLAVFAIVCAVLAVAVPAAFWRINRAMRAEEDRNRPGTSWQDMDLCELLWALPEFDADHTRHHKGDKT